MTLNEAISQACQSVGIVPPRGQFAMRKWVKADTNSGKNGKGDGRLICDDDRVTAINWQTGDKTTVWLKENRTVEDRRRYAQQRAEDEQRDREKAARTAQTAERMVRAAKPSEHSYLKRKGFPDERPLVLAADAVRQMAGYTNDRGQFVPADYLVPPAAAMAIVVPARIGQKITSAQLIWEDGTKKFLFGGEMGAASHRIATGSAAWLCEGYATGLSLRAALRGLKRRDTILVCFSAANIVKVAAEIDGQCYIAADHDAPPAAKPEQFGGLGAGEYFAQKAGKPYAMPPEQTTDFNDYHQTAGIFAVQRLVNGLLRGVPM
jgi:putative DNA primase/helicase